MHVMYVYMTACQDANALRSLGRKLYIKKKRRKYSLPALLVQSLFSDLRTQLTSVQLLCTLHVESTVFLVWELLIRTNKFVASKIILGTQKKSNLERAEIGSLPFEMENSHRMTIERKIKKSSLSPTLLSVKKLT